MRVHSQRPAASALVPIRRQLLAVLVLGLMAYLAYKHIAVAAWMAWLGVAMATIYLLFSGWLYDWSQKWAEAARAARGQTPHEQGRQA